jgi:hypothetical protein
VFNNVRKATKAKYSMLNIRQVSDAVVQDQAYNIRLKSKKVVFGGSKTCLNYDKVDAKKAKELV